MKPLILVLLLMGSLSVVSCSSTVKEITPVDTLHSEINFMDISEEKMSQTQDSLLHQSSLDAEIIGKAFGVQMRMSELKALYYQTENDIYRMQYNKLVPINEKLRLQVKAIQQRESK